MLPISPVVQIPEPQRKVLCAQLSVDPTPVEPKPAPVAIAATSIAATKKLNPKQQERLTEILTTPRTIKPKPPINPKYIVNVSHLLYSGYALENYFPSLIINYEEFGTLLFTKLQDAGYLKLASNQQSPELVASGALYVLEEMVHVDADFIVYVEASALSRIKEIVIDFLKEKLFEAWGLSIYIPSPDCDKLIPIEQIERSLIQAIRYIFLQNPKLRSAPVLQCFDVDSENISCATSQLNSLLCSMYIDFEKLISGKTLATGRKTGRPESSWICTFAGADWKFMADGRCHVFNLDAFYINFQGEFRHLAKVGEWSDRSKLQLALQNLDEGRAILGQPEEISFLALRILKTSSRGALIENRKELVYRAIKDFVSVETPLRILPGKVEMFCAKHFHPQLSISHPLVPIYLTHYELLFMLQELDLESDSDIEKEAIYKYTIAIIQHWIALVPREDRSLVQGLQCLLKNPEDSDYFLLMFNGAFLIAAPHHKHINPYSLTDGSTHLTTIQLAEMAHCFNMLYEPALNSSAFLCAWVYLNEKYPAIDWRGFLNQWLGAFNSSLFEPKRTRKGHDKPTELQFVPQLANTLRSLEPIASHIKLPAMIHPLLVSLKMFQERFKEHPAVIDKLRNIEHHLCSRMKAVLTKTPKDSQQLKIQCKYLETIAQCSPQKNRKEFRKKATHLLLQALSNKDTLLIETAMRIYLLLTPSQADDQEREEQVIKTILNILVHRKGLDPTLLDLCEKLIQKVFTTDAQQIKISELFVLIRENSSVDKQAVVVVELLHSYKPAIAHDFWELIKAQSISNTATLKISTILGLTAPKATSSPFLRQLTEIEQKSRQANEQGMGIPQQLKRISELQSEIESHWKQWDVISKTSVSAKYKELLKLFTTFNLSSCELDDIVLILLNNFKLTIIDPEQNEELLEIFLVKYSSNPKREISDKVISQLVHTISECFPLVFFVDSYDGDNLDSTLHDMDKRLNKLILPFITSYLYMLEKTKTKPNKPIIHFFFKAFKASKETDYYYMQLLFKIMALYPDWLENDWIEHFSHRLGNLESGGSLGNLQRDPAIFQFAKLLKTILPHIIAKDAEHLSWKNTLDRFAADVLNELNLRFITKVVLPSLKPDSKLRDSDRPKREGLEPTRKHPFLISSLDTLVEACIERALSHPEYLEDALHAIHTYSFDPFLSYLKIMPLFQKNIERFKKLIPLVGSVLTQIKFIPLKYCSLDSVREGVAEYIQHCEFLALKRETAELAIISHSIITDVIAYLDSQRSVLSSQPIARRDKLIRISPLQLLDQQKLAREQLTIKLLFENEEELLKLVRVLPKISKPEGEEISSIHQQMIDRLAMEVANMERLMTLHARKNPSRALAIISELSNLLQKQPNIAPLIFSLMEEAREFNIIANVLGLTYSKKEINEGPWEKVVSIYLRIVAASTKNLNPDELFLGWSAWLKTLTLINLKLHSSQMPHVSKIDHLITLRNQLLSMTFTMAGQLRVLQGEKSPAKLEQFIDLFSKMPNDQWAEVLIQSFAAEKAVLLPAFEKTLSKQAFIFLKDLLSHIQFLQPLVRIKLDEREIQENNFQNTLTYFRALEDQLSKLEESMRSDKEGSPKLELPESLEEIAKKLVIIHNVCFVTTKSQSLKIAEMDFSGYSLSDFTLLLSSMLKGVRYCLENQETLLRKMVDFVPKTR